MNYKQLIEEIYRAACGSRTGSDEDYAIGYITGLCQFALTQSEIKEGENNPSEETSEALRALDTFEEWEKNGTKVEKLGIIVASRDVDLNYDDMGVVRENNVYYTYNKAMEVEKKHLKPNGWRLPTKDEWQALYDEYGNDIVDVLGLQKNGYISAANGSLYDQGTYGYYWSSTAGSSATLAYDFGFNASDFYPQGHNLKGYGSSVRCVKDIRGDEE